MDLSVLPKAFVDVNQIKHNSYILVALTARILLKKGWGTEEILEFLREARSGNYDNILNTVLKYTVQAPEDQNSLDEKPESEDCISCGEPTSDDDLYCNICLTYSIDELGEY